MQKLSLKKAGVGVILDVGVISVEYDTLLLQSNYMPPPFSGSLLLSSG